MEEQESVKLGALLYVVGVGSLPRSVLIGPPLESSKPSSFIHCTIGFLSPVVARGAVSVTLMGVHLVDRMKVDKEVREGKNRQRSWLTRLGDRGTP